MNTMAMMTTTIKMTTIQNLYITLSGEIWDLVFVLLLLLVESVLGYLIIIKVQYTEIDWIAYMQEVDFWLIDGEYDYRNIYGNTGPLVYPAGFLYLFGFLQWLTNREISKAQIIFLILYVMSQAIVFKLYLIVLQEIRKRRTNNQQQQNNQKEEEDSKTTTLETSHIIWSFRIGMGCLCLSKRYHSIFLLRLFNDAPTMLVAYISFYCFTLHKWNLGCFIFSLAVSLKMNILLFAPGLLYLLIETSPLKTIPRLAICGITQLIIGSPFLMRYPISYLRKAFELDRQFYYKWTVNWKFLSEDFFLSKPLAIALLGLHLSLLGIYLFRVYYYHNSNKKNNNKGNNNNNNNMSGEHILSILFISNFIGICCARTIHYQFYCWYFSALPYLLWRQTNYPLLLRLMILGGIEYAYLTYPATPLSSTVLQIAHWSILLPCIFGLGPAGVVGDNNNKIDTTTTDEKKEKSK